MSKTLSDLKSYARAGVLELDEKRWTTVLLTDDINRSIQKVWRDIKPLAIKSLKKEAVKTGSIFAPPSDMSEDPNSIHSVVASDAGTRGNATVTYTDPTANIIYTANEPGTTNIHLMLDAGGNPLGTPLAGQVLISCVYTTYWTIQIDFVSDDLTCAQICALINAHPVAGNLLTATTGYASVKPKPDRGTALTLSAGTGANYYPAMEWTEDEYNRLSADTYRGASTTDPRWCLTANSGGQRIIKMAPNTVTFTKLIYSYFPALLVNDTDVCAIPEEFQELVLIEILRKGYNRLGDANKEAVQIGEYDKRAKELFEKYGAGLVNQKNENDRIKAND